MNSSQNNTEPSIFFPQGGILLWMIISVELITFLLAFTFFFLDKQSNLELFLSMQSKLNLSIGTINTLTLIISGYFVAGSVIHLRKQNNRSSSQFVLLAILFGILFLVLKSYEYSEKLSVGYVLGSNLFFTYYWLLTFFHFVHVLLGVFILIILYFSIKKNTNPEETIHNLESGASFWHLCDIIWILLFPTLYLLR
jgi:nitric oxide reductase NorE protein